MADVAAAATGAAGDVAATVKKWTPINWALISSPWNWAIILLMLVLASFAVDIILTWYHSDDAEQASQ